MTLIWNRPTTCFIGKLFISTIVYTPQGFLHILWMWTWTKTKLDFDRLSYFSVFNKVISTSFNKQKKRKQGIKKIQGYDINDCYSYMQKFTQKHKQNTLDSQFVLHNVYVFHSMYKIFMKFELIILHTHSKGVFREFMTTTYWYMN